MLVFDRNGKTFNNYYYEQMMKSDDPDQNNNEGDKSVELQEIQLDDLGKDLELLYKKRIEIHNSGGVLNDE